MLNIKPLWMGAMISAIFAIFGLSFMITMHFRSSSSYLHYLKPLDINITGPTPTELSDSFTELENLVLNKSQECSIQSVYYYNTRAAIKALNVTQLMVLANNVTLQCNAAMAEIQEKIALVSSFQRQNHTVLQNGTGYEIRKLVLGTQLEIVYLYLFSWDMPMFVSSNIIYSLFVSTNSCTEGIRPLLPNQSAKFVGNVTVESYQLNCSNETLVFYTSGTGTIQLTQDLVIYL